MRVIAQGASPSLRVGEVFSHTTSLLLRGVPIIAPLDVHVTAPHTKNRTRATHIIGHRKRAPFRTVFDRSGLPCMPELEALLQAASMLNFAELVVALDHIVKVQGRSSNPFSISTLETIEAALSRGPVRRARQLRAALQVARTGAESRMETLLHFELARMGLDILEMQSAVFDAQGNWIGRFDQVDHKRKLIFEYDGEQHRTDRSQYLHDERRLQRVREAGYEVVRLHYEDFFRENIDSTRALLCKKLGLSPRPVPAELARLFAECPVVAI